MLPVSSGFMLTFSSVQRLSTAFSLDMKINTAAL
jgi:hypothetical protein